MKKKLAVLVLVTAATFLFFGCEKKATAAASTAGTLPAATDTATATATAAPASSQEKIAVSVKQEVRTVKPDYTIRFAYYDAATWPDISKTPLRNMHMHWSSKVS